MTNSIISEGKTTNEAIEKGLKELKVSKDKVEIKVLEDPNKKSFFSILTPRVVKVELILKEEKRSLENEKRSTENKQKIEYERDINELENAKGRVEKFLNEFLNQIDNSLQYKISIEECIINVNITGQASGILIGYRGESLNAIQTILSSIANKNAKEKIKLILDIENYRQKRVKVLEDLAEKVSKTVLRTGKSITLEPMSAFERKIIHSKLQENDKIETYSIGENENRRIVISKVKK